MAKRFAHPSEQKFADVLTSFGIQWEYEPQSFPIVWKDGLVSEELTPDFFLPEYGMFLEVTTLKQSLVTAKNRKIRLFRELYPDKPIRILYKKDLEAILLKYV